MLALPAAYRVWTIYHPNTEHPRQTLSKYLERSAEENALRLLMTPLAKWDETEKSAHPVIAGWLQAHERTVLPWEWTDEACRKDPEGHRRLWISLLTEQKSVLAVRLKGEREAVKALDREIWIASTIHTHRTNQIARVSGMVETNAFPVTIRVECLEKGRLWGWNRRTEERRLADRDDWLSDHGWLTVESRQAGAEASRLSSLQETRRVSLAKADALQALLERLDGLIESGKTSVPEDSLPRILLGLLTD